MNKIHPIALQFFYNFIADSILLSLVKWDLFPEIKQRQIIKAAFFFSATYIIWERAVPEIPPYLSLVLKWATIIILLCHFFKIHSVKSFSKTILSFMLWLFLLGGSLSFFLTSIHIESVNGKKAAYKAVSVMFFMAGLLFLWQRKRKREKKEKNAKANTYEIQITRKAKEVMCTGMYDSGNLLSSQITGQGVCIIAMEQAKELLLPEEEAYVMNFFAESVENFSWKIWTKQFQNGIYILQYSSMGKKNAKIPGILAEQIVVLKNEEVLVETKGMLGISPEKLSEENKFSVLLPADIFERKINRSII